MTLLGTSDADTPRLYYGLSYSWNPQSSLRAFWFEEFFFERGAPSRWSDPGFTEATCDYIGKRILPVLKKLNDVVDILTFKHSLTAFRFKQALSYPLDRVHLDTGAGRLKDALAGCRWLSEQPRQTAIWSESACARIVDDMMPLLEVVDRPGLAVLLRNWEEEAVSRLGLTSLHETTPFAFELSSAS
ncbi:hypothetical protein [Bosea thiooxidans]|nr:hypothetical protein [Bosea sp. (in: a-proteobacteria)]